MKNEKESNNNNKYLFTFTFLFRTTFILLENMFGNTYFISLHLYYSFSAWQVIGNAAMKHYYPYRYAMVLQTLYFDPNTIQQTRYFTVDFDSNGLSYILHILFKYSYFREVLSIQRKTMSFVKENFWLTPCKQPDLHFAKLFFRLIISQTYVHNLERYCLYWC